MLAKDSLVEEVQVVTRADTRNNTFFSASGETAFFSVRVTDTFNFSYDGRAFVNAEQHSVADFDIILLRLAPPIPETFLTKLASVFNPERIINRPDGIVKTGNKRFLLEVEELCPPLSLVDSVEGAIRKSKEYQIVLKPLNTYGGTGIIRMNDGIVITKSREIGAREYFNSSDVIFPLLGMKFLKGVSNGDKRNIVVNGQIIGSTLRMPAEGGWLCNISQGGTSSLSTPDPEEIQIAKALSRRLKREGVIIYGFDTLVGDDGKRLLSELNTTSVGGLVHLERDDSRDVLKGAVETLMDYIDLEIFG